MTKKINKAALNLCALNGSLTQIDEKLRRFLALKGKIKIIENEDSTEMEWIDLDFDGHNPLNWMRLDVDEELADVIADIWALSVDLSYYIDNSKLIYQAEALDRAIKILESHEFETAQAVRTVKGVINGEEYI